MSWVAAGVASAQLTFAGVQAYRGWRQKKKGEKAEAALQRPDYEIPEEVYASLNLAERQALEGLPAEQQKEYVENLQSMQATALSQLSDRKAGLTGIGQTAQTVTEGYRDLLSMEAQARKEGQQMYMQGLENLAGYKDLQYQQNLLQPYQQDLAYARAMQGAGLQNINVAGQSAMQAASSAAPYVQQGAQGMKTQTPTDSDSLNISTTYTGGGGGAPSTGLTQPGAPSTPTGFGDQNNVWGNW